MRWYIIIDRANGAGEEHFSVEATDETNARKQAAERLDHPQYVGASIKEVRPA